MQQCSNVATALCLDQPGIDFGVRRYDFPCGLARQVNSRHRTPSRFILWEGPLVCCSSSCVFFWKIYFSHRAIDPWPHWTPCNGFVGGRAHLVDLELGEHPATETKRSKAGSTNCGLPSAMQAVYTEGQNTDFPYGLARRRILLGFIHQKGPPLFCVFVEGLL